MKVPAFGAFVLALFLVTACEKKYELSADRGNAEHMVLMVWDGMRPDLVSERNTPNLWALAQRGVFFANHHPEFPSTTEVNGTALATGMRPGRSGIIGNREFRPALDPRKSVAMEELGTVRKDDELKHGKHIATATVAETVQQAGFRTAVAGTKPVALLQDRAEARTSKAASESVDVFAGKSMPADAVVELQKARGEFPPLIKFPNTAQDRWTTDMLTGGLWKNGVPKYSVLWMSDPDFSQHATTPGAPAALAAIRSADDMLGIVLATLKEKGVIEQTDIFVVSDHGFSTVSGTADIAQALIDAGLRAHRTYATPPDNGDILIVNTGATLLLYVTGHDADTIAKLVRVMQELPSTGVVFSREAIDGTFPLSAAGVDSPDAPDVVVAPRWNSEKNKFGVPGTLTYDGGTKLGVGMHGSLSPFDQTNTLIGAGPDFRAGWRDELPSGNIDVAPTVLWLMGIRPLTKLDGRVLFEALRKQTTDAGRPEDKRIEATRDLGTIRWTQYLRIVTHNGATYLLEGNGAQTAR